jgi:UDP-N-acetylmuramate--alanine ligase
MNEHKSYFFCGIGGSGMLPLASIVRARGDTVSGSDRALDQGRTAPKFDYLRGLGIDLFAQDGSGMKSADQILVASAAVEDSVPDVQAAIRLGAARASRAGLLAELVNGAATSIAVGGTSGKSTVTGMIGWILHKAGRDPTVMNGAVMKNFATADAPFASALVGDPALFVSEVDESDGSIALYNPTVAVVNNISHDHKSMDELHALFADFAGRAQVAVINLDNPESAKLATETHPGRIVTFGIDNADALLDGSDVRERPDGIDFRVTDREGAGSAGVSLSVPGRHNASNALAAIAAAIAAGVTLPDAAAALGSYAGLKRRMDIVGTAGGVTVIDDFGHNPDKIAATLTTLHAFPGRLLLFFQPHGFGPLKVMKDELIAAFVDQMAADDRLILCDPAFFGGTVDRVVGSDAIVDGVAAGGRTAEHIPARADCGDRLVALARPGDRIVIMGARDDTLSSFANEVLGRLGA